jgi:CrcB protein
MVTGHTLRTDVLTVLAVGAGGVIGANARWAISEWSNDVWSTAFPWGTLLINVSGSLILGLFLSAQSRLTGNPYARLIIATGILGAYTTFSTFVYETVRLVQHGDGLIAVTYVLASLGLGLAAAVLGIRAGRTF